MSRRAEVKVGLVVMAGIALIMVGTIWMQGWRIGSEERELVAWFREVGQLQSGNPVKLRGVPIGRVESIALDDRSTGVILRMSVASDVILPEDPVVILSPESLFGDWQAEIIPRNRFPFYNYAVAPDPQMLPGYSLPDVSRLTAVADRIAENLAVITDRIDIAFTDETAVNIRQAIENIQEVTSRLTGLVEAQGRTVEGLAAGLETTTTTLNEAASSAGRTFAQVESAIAEGQVTDIVRNVALATAQLDTLTRALALVSRDLGGAATSADSAFTSLAQVLASLEAGEGTLGLLLQDTALYRDLVATNALIQDLLEDFQRNPRKYINLRVF
ncbi:MAG TPA: MlaD family protein [Longimicrobiales bacterium]|nr:MlaD family protein [Longimicrobiales bacterium]